MNPGSARIDHLLPLPQQEGGEQRHEKRILVIGPYATRHPRYETAFPDRKEETPPTTPRAASPGSIGCHRFHWARGGTVPMLRKLVSYRVLNRQELLPPKNGSCQPFSFAKDVPAPVAGPAHLRRFLCD